MNTSDRPNPQSNYRDGLSKITREIVEKSSGGDFIYRGEPECYEKISSSLYRQGQTGYESGQFNIERVQKGILKEARNYIREQDKKDFEILTELQHYGSQTNLIDFTTDYHIALFFACDGSHDNDGRVILLKRTEEMNEKYRIEKPQNPQNRVMTQKSIFAQPPKGFIDPKDTITIPVPANLKQWILIHLRNFQDISTQSIYNDLHGFIRHSNLRSSREALFPVVFADMIVEDMADKSQTPEERKDQFQKAIDHYTEGIQYAPYDATNYVKQGQWYAEVEKIDLAIETFSKAIFLKPDYAHAYHSRGWAYGKKGEVDRAIEDFDMAINLNPHHAGTYNNRGMAYKDKGQIDCAIENFNEAIKLKPDYAYAYNNRGWACIKEGDVDRAIEDFNNAIELNPSNPEPYFSRGVAHYSKEEYDLARKDFGKVRGLKPDYLADLKQKSGINLPADIAAMLTPEETDVGRKKAQNTAHPVEPNVEIAIKQIKQRYDRAWKTLAKF